MLLTASMIQGISASKHIAEVFVFSFSFAFMVTFMLAFASAFAIAFVFALMFPVRKRVELESTRN